MSERRSAGSGTIKQSLTKYYVNRVITVDPPPMPTSTMSAGERLRDLATKACRAAATKSIVIPSSSQKRDARLPFMLQDMNTMERRLFEHYVYCKPRSYGRKKKKLTSLQERMRVLITLTPNEKYKELAESLPNLSRSRKPPPRLTYNITELIYEPSYDRDTRVMRYYLRPEYFDVEPARRVRSYPSCLGMVDLTYDTSKAAYYRRKAHRDQYGPRSNIFGISRTRNAIKMKKELQRQNQLQRCNIGKSVSTVRQWKSERDAKRVRNWIRRSKKPRRPEPNSALYKVDLKRADINMRRIKYKMKRAERRKRKVRFTDPAPVIRDYTRAVGRTRSDRSVVKTITPFKRRRHRMMSGSCLANSKSMIYKRYKNFMQSKVRFLMPRGFKAEDIKTHG